MELGKPYRLPVLYRWERWGPWRCVYVSFSLTIMYWIVGSTIAFRGRIDHFSSISALARIILDQVIFAHKIFTLAWVMHPSLDHPGKARCMSTACSGKRYYRNEDMVRKGKNFPLWTHNWVKDRWVGIIHCNESGSISQAQIDIGGSTGWSCLEKAFCF